MTSIKRLLILNKHRWTGPSWRYRIIHKLIKIRLTPKHKSGFIKRNFINTEVIIVIFVFVSIQLELWMKDVLVLYWTWNQFTRKDVNVVVVNTSFDSIECKVDLIKDFFYFTIILTIILLILLINTCVNLDCKRITLRFVRIAILNFVFIFR